MPPHSNTKDTKGFTKFTKKDFVCFVVVAQRDEVPSLRTRILSHIMNEAVKQSSEMYLEDREIIYFVPLDCFTVTFAIERNSATFLTSS
jgi:hypothetical protein